MTDAIAQARHDWINRVLGLDIAAAKAPAADTPAKPRGVAFRKLLLRWRDAQRTFQTNITALGAAILALPEIRADPRYDEISQAVDRLPQMVPNFGGRLEDVLDAGLNATHASEAEALAAEGIAAIDAYREQLAAASHLLDLERLAADDLGRAVPLHGALDQALAELRQQLAA